MKMLLVSSYSFSPKRSRAAVLVISISALTVLTSCAIQRQDFDAYLNSSIGRPIAEVEYDAMMSKTGGRSLKSESPDSATYEYSPQGSKCAWEVVVDKGTSQVRTWRYLSEDAKNACNDLPTRRGV
jgi:hypothetical protein